MMNEDFQLTMIQLLPLSVPRLHSFIAFCNDSIDAKIGKTTNTNEEINIIKSNNLNSSL